MRGILIDDEALALRGLESQLKKVGGVEVIGSFQVAADALEAAKALKPDVVFLDIDMPEMNGLEAAERFQDLNLAIEVVFVTAYEGYAVKAFELQALDYVLKPVQTQRLALSIQRIASRLQENAARKPAEKPARILCFQRLRIDCDKQESFAWRTAKSQELFAYLLSRNGQPVRKDKLVDILWPEVDYKKAYTQLYTTIYQLRRSLEAAAVAVQIVNSGNSYSLDPGGMTTDVEEWERELKSDAEMAEMPLNELEEWLNRYEGDYFEEHDYVWAESESERLRGLWLHHSMRLSQRLKENGDLVRAAAWLLKIQGRYPYLEETYSALMELYAGMGERSLVAQQYAKLGAMLEEEYGAEPSEEIQAWHANWMRS